MVVSVICQNCKKSFDFDTESEPEILLEEREIRHKESYVATCPHCGETNIVEV